MVRKPSTGERREPTWCISNRRRASRCSPNRTLPPLPVCFGARPSQAKNSRPDLEAPASPMVACCPKQRDALPWHAIRARCGPDYMLVDDFSCSHIHRVQLRNLLSNHSPTGCRPFVVPMIWAAFIAVLRFMTGPIWG